MKIDEDIISTAEKITDCFFNSKGMLEAMHEYAQNNDCSPLSMAFSIELFNKMMRQGIPEWDTCTLLASRAVEDMEAAGLMPEFKKKTQ